MSVEELELEQRRRLGWHEGGHAVVAASFGIVQEGPLSIVETANWRGVCFHGPLPGAPLAALEEVDPAAPLSEWPHPVRRVLERRMLIAVAGLAGEQLAPPLPPWAGGPVAVPDVDRLLEHVGASDVHALPEREAELLAVGDDPQLEPPVSDLAVAYSLAELLVDDQAAAGLYVRVMLVQARRLLEREELLGRRLSRLAGELERHGTLSSAAVRRLLETKEEDSSWLASRRSLLPVAAASSPA